MKEKEGCESSSDIEGYQAVSSSSTSSDDNSDKGDADEDKVTKIVRLGERSTTLSSKKESKTKVFPRRRRSSDLSFAGESRSMDDDLSVSSLESQKLDNDNEGDNDTNEY